MPSLIWQSAIRLFSTALPGLLIGVSCFISFFAPIDSATHKQITEQAQRA